MLSCSSVEAATESEATHKFLNSLQELRELRSQIQNAADYCESTFKNAHQKKTVMDNTREYICRSVVAMVDHLGCVSANLDSTINESNRLSEAELRINSLKQKVVLHGEYNHSLALSRISTRVLQPRHFSRYISPPAAATISNQDKPQEKFSQLETYVEADSITKKKHGNKIEQDLSIFVYTSTINKLYKSPSMSDAEFSKLQSFTSVLPVGHGLSIPQETKRPPFHFQMVREHGRRILQWRIQDSGIVTLIRRRKESLKFLKPR